MTHRHPVHLVRSDVFRVIKFFLSAAARTGYNNIKIHLKGRRRAVRPTTPSAQKPAAPNASPLHIYVRGSDIALYPYNTARRNTINLPYTRSLLPRKAEFILFSPHGRVSYFAPHSSVSFPDAHRTHTRRERVVSDYLKFIVRRPTIIHTHTHTIV